MEKIMEQSTGKENSRLRNKAIAPSLESQDDDDDIFQENDPCYVLNEESGELVVLDYTRIDIKDLCRGCLGIKNVSDMQDSNIGGFNITALYEDLTKIKMDTTNVPARMCPNCVSQLSKIDQFINMLQHSYKVLERATQEIESLKYIGIMEPDCYQEKKTSVLNSVLRNKYSSVTKLENASNFQTEISSEENRPNNSFLDSECWDDLSVRNDSASSDDEIPLAERFKIDVRKAVTSLKRRSTKETSKVVRKRCRKAKENLENVPENDSSRGKIKSSHLDTCPMCLKEIRYLTKHLQSIHSIDWIKAKCLKCSYKNTDKEKLLEHCKVCSEREVMFNGKDYEVKREWKEETNDIDCDPDFEIENRDRAEIKDIEYDLMEDIEGKQRGRPTKHRNKKYKFECNRCEEGYKTYEEIESHFKATHYTESTCILCDQEYSNSFSLLYHMMVKHGRLKCCRLCLVSFRNSEELNMHYKSEEHNTRCTVCGEQFKNRKALYEHRRKKHLNPQLENQKYKCPECPKEFANQNNIRRHILVAHNDLRFLCDTCGQSYTTKRNLKLHIQKFHEGLEIETKNTKKNFFCEACGRELKIFHKYAIAMHRAKHKGHNYVCKKCYETFETEEMFKKHVEAFGHQLYECHKCQSQFVREENFKIHLKNHDAPGWNKNMFATWGKSAKLRNEKGEFVCSYCPKVFKDKQRLDNHVRVHTNERPYKCHICGKGFKTWIHRKTHLNIHLGIKKWVCKFCSKAFTNSCTLKGHEMIHTGERPHRCPECKKGFITMSAMKKHRMVHFRSGGTSYGKKGNRILKDEDKTESDNEENTEFVYKYGQMFAGSDVSYESYAEPPKVEPGGLVSIEKELSC